MDKIIIAGAGIGGLATALAMAHQGIETIVLEAAPVLGEIGAGIQLGPNAFHAFDQLGLGEEIRSGAVFVDQFRLMDAASGEQISNFSLGESFRARFKNPYAVVHRADLHASFVAHCRATGLVDLRTDHKVAGYEQSESGIRVLLANQAPLEGRALIGADGIRSAIRAQLVKDGEPRVSGHTTFRSVIPTERMPEDLRWNAVTIWVGPKCHIVHYPLKGSKVFNLVVTSHNDVETPVNGVAVTDAMVRESFGHVAPMAKSIIERGIDWRMWVLCDRDPIQGWADGRIALLGDAAHPTLQYFAQGACQAIEDGLCISSMLASHEDIPSAFRAYSAIREVRTARVQVGSRIIGDHVFHPDGAEAAMRNATIGGMSDDGFYDFMAWLYDRQDFAA